MTTQETQKKKPVSIPYFAHEGEMYRLSRIIRRILATTTIVTLLSTAVTVLMIFQKRNQ